MDAGELRARRHHDRRRRRAARPATTPAAAATSSTASPARCRQAEALDEHHRRRGRSTSSIDLEVPDDVVLERLASRRVCIDCGTNYSVDAPPKYDWTCDNCGGEVVQRDDDTEEAIDRAPRPLRAADRARSSRATTRAGPAGRRSTASGPPTRSPTGIVAVDRRRAERRACHDRAVAVRAAPTSSPKMRRAGRVVAEMHERIRAAIRPGVTTARARPDRPRGARAPRRHVELPRLPRLPGGDLRVAQRHDRARHPRTTSVLEEGDIISIDCGAIVEGWHGDAAFTARRRRRSPPRPQRLIEVTEAVARAPASPQMVDGQPPRPTSATPCRRWPRAPGSRWCGSTSATPSAQAMHEEPERARTTGAPGKGPKLRAGNVFAVEPMVNAGTRRDASCSTTAGRVVTADGTLVGPLSSTPSPSPTTAPRS